MSTNRNQIEHLEHWWEGEPWKNFSFSRKWLKKQMNKFIRRENKKIEEDDIGYKSKRKPTNGWEY